jgi:hypothetical protein
MAVCDPRLIVPLDLPTTGQARAMVETLGDAVSFYKVGLELFATDGMTLARELKASGKRCSSTGSCTTSAPRCSAPPRCWPSPAATY